MFKKFYKTLSILFVIFSMVLVFGCKEPEEELVDPETPTEETTSSDDSSDKKDKNDKTNKTDKTDGTTDDSSSSDGGNASQNPNNGGTTQATHYVPVIRITTTNPKEPEHPLAFVTEPISDTVKLHTHTWGGTQYDSNPSPWKEKCKITVIDENNTNTITDATATVKVRGNWTTSYDKKGLKIKFKEEQSMLGLHSGEQYEEWVLLAAWKDFSMLRDYTAYNLARLMSNNYYASDAKLVEVYINDTYWGVYLLAEQQEAKRVGITVAEENDGIDETGYLLEFDTYGGIIDGKSLDGENLVEQDFVKMDDYGTFYDINGNVARNYDDDTGSYKDFNAYYTIKSDYDNDKKTFIKNYLDSVWYICREAIESDGQDLYELSADYQTAVPSSSPTTVEECVSKVVDIDSLVNTYILQEIACDLDLNWSSFYMDADFGANGNKKLTFEAPWDFDSCFGNHVNRQIGEGGINHLFGAANDAVNKGNPWTILFAKETWFQNMVLAKWNEMTAQHVKEQVISKINEISKDPVYVAAFKRNYDKWKNIGTAVGTELPSEAIACSTQRQAANLLVNFLNQRFTMLDSDFNNFTASNKVYYTSGSTSFSGSFVSERKEEEIVVETIPRTYSGTFSVTATTEGLEMTKTGESYWTHSQFVIEKIGIDYKKTQIGWIDENTNTYLFSDVTAGAIYKVSLIQMDENWCGWHQSVKLDIKAIGGNGD